MAKGRFRKWLQRLLAKKAMIFANVVETVDIFNDAKALIEKELSGLTKAQTIMKRMDVCVDKWKDLFKSLIKK